MSQSYTPPPQKRTAPAADAPQPLLWVLTFDADNRLVSMSAFDDWAIFQRHLEHHSRHHTNQIFWGEYAGLHDAENNFFEDEAT